MIYETAGTEEKAVVAAIFLKTHRKGFPGFSVKSGVIYDAREIVELAKTAGAAVLEEIMIKTNRIDPSYYIGKGKVSETADLLARSGANLIIFDCDLSPAQQGNLEEALGVKVVNRTQIILDIFARRAKTKEGKLQVELAQLNYLLPRLAGKGTEMSRLGAGIGTRGPGEMKLEVDRRRIKDRINKLNAEIENLRKHRSQGRKKRSRITNIALIGYTNAGKSTLLNLLADSGETAEDQLFSTLDPAVRKITLPENVQAVLIDTVGFIKQLPHHLVAAFRATLEEVTTADILLNVLDAKHPMREQHNETVADTVNMLGAGSKPIITVLNKTDLLGKDEYEKVMNIFRGAIPISAKTGYGAEKLIGALSRQAGSCRKKVKLKLPQLRGDLVARLHRDSNILAKKYTGEDIMLETEIDDKLMEEFREYIVEK